MDELGGGSEYAHSSFCLTPDVFGPEGDVDVEQLLHGQGEGLLIAHHAHVVQAVEVREGLEIGLVLDELLCPPVEESDVGVGANNRLEKTRNANVKCGDKDSLLSVSLAAGAKQE